MRNIGIECESIEDQTWGVGRIVKKLLEEISNRPELAKEFRFFLYFKSRIPDLPFLNNSIFVKKIIGPSSFSLYYYVFLPIKLWFEKLDLMFFPNYMLPVFFRGRSLVMLTEDIYYEMTAGDLPFRYKLAYKIFAGWSAKHATKIMAISETSKKEVSRLFGINPARIVVNQLGVTRPKPITYNLKPENHILYVGQAFPRRHLKETMLAFEKIAPQFPNLMFLAIGSDKYNPPLISRLTNELNQKLGEDRIIYKEYVSEQELAELYSGAKLLLYVSSKEAFGLPPLEALGYGVPAVVSDSDVSHEIFGDNAFFVNRPDNIASIAEAIKQGLLDGAKRQEILTSAERILSKYTWQAHASRFIEIAKTL